MIVASTVGSKMPASFFPSGNCSPHAKPLWPVFKLQKVTASQEDGAKKVWR